MKKSPEQKESALGNISREKREVLLLEISLVETSEASAVASLVLSHFVNRIVDGIRTLLLSELGNAELILACTLLCSDTSLEIALGITQNLTQQLSKTRCVVSLLESITLVSLCNLRITLTVSLASHGKIFKDLSCLQRIAA